MWDDFLKTEFTSDYYIQLSKTLAEEYENYVCYPSNDNIFNAFKLCKFPDLKVVILGQDPYHNFGEANGLAFSVQQGIKIPSSLRNIFKELQSDLGCSIPLHGNLTKWAKQGVLLLNATLTVRENNPNSHQNIGWEMFTDHVIDYLNSYPDPLVYILWGNNARKKKKMIDEKHFIIESYHPSGLSASRGFFGSKPFSKANNYLSMLNKEQINWQL